MWFAAGEWSGVPASGDGDFEHSGLSVHSDTSSGVDLGGVLDGRQTSGSSHDKTPKSSREGPNGQANSHNRRSQRPDTKAPQRTKTAEGFREKQKGESNQHKMFGGQKEMEDGGAEEVVERSGVLCVKLWRERDEDSSLACASSQFWAAQAD